MELPCTEQTPREAEMQVAWEHLYSLPQDTGSIWIKITSRTVLKGY